MVEKHIDCDEMFRSDFIEGWRQDEGELKAPRLKFLVDARADHYYSYQGRVNVTEAYFDGKPRFDSNLNYNPFKCFSNLNSCPGWSRGLCGRRGCLSR